MKVKYTISYVAEESQEDWEVTSDEELMSKLREEIADNPGTTITVEEVKEEKK